MKFNYGKWLVEHQKTYWIITSILWAIIGIALGYLLGADLNGVLHILACGH